MDILNKMKIKRISQSATPYNDWLLGNLQIQISFLFEGQLQVYTLMQNNMNFYNSYMQAISNSQRNKIIEEYITDEKLIEVVGHIRIDMKTLKQEQTVMF